jgi:hypothetical protein
MQATLADHTQPSLTIMQFATREIDSLALELANALSRQNPSVAAAQVSCSSAAAVRQELLASRIFIMDAVSREAAAAQGPAEARVPTSRSLGLRVEGG